MKGRQAASCRLEVVKQDGSISDQPWLRRVHIQVQDGLLTVYTSGRIRMEFLRLELKSIKEFGYQDNAFYLVSGGTEYRFSRIFPWKMPGLRRVLDGIYDTSSSPPDGRDFIK